LKTGLQEIIPLYCLINLILDLGAENANVDLVVGDAIRAAHNSVVGAPALVKDLSDRAGDIVAAREASLVWAYPGETPGGKMGTTYQLAA
jgi:hypothetical protein